MTTLKLKNKMTLARCTLDQFAKNIGYAPTTLQIAMKKDSFSSKLTEAIKSYTISFEPLELMLMISDNASMYYQPLRYESIYTVTDNSFIFYGKEIDLDRATSIVSDIIYNRLITHECYLEEKWSTYEYSQLSIFEFSQCNKGEEYLCSEHINSGKASDTAKTVQIGVRERTPFMFEVLSPEETKIAIIEAEAAKDDRILKALTQVRYTLSSDPLGLFSHFNREYIVEEFFGKHDTAERVNTHFQKLAKEYKGDRLKFMAAVACRDYTLDKIYHTDAMPNRSNKVETDELIPF